jgi:hypothetical protein
VKATSHFGYLFKHDVKSGFFFVESFKFDNSLMPFFFYYFLSLGNKKKCNGTQTKNFCKTMIPTHRISRKDFLELPYLDNAKKIAGFLNSSTFFLWIMTNVATSQK